MPEVDVRQMPKGYKAVVEHRVVAFGFKAWIGEIRTPDNYPIAELGRFPVSTAASEDSLNGLLLSRVGNLPRYDHTAAFFRHCPVCLAPPGSPCRAPESGSISDDPHADRSPAK